MSIQFIYEAESLIYLVLIVDINPVCTIYQHKTNHT